MNGKSIWRSLARHVLLLGLGAMGSTVTGLAVAGCAQFSPLGVPPPPDWDVPTSMPTAGALIPAVYRPGAEQFIRVVDDRDRDHDGRDAGIVGLWRFTFISDGTAYPQPIPAGVVLDFGTTQWHSDGTEIMISGGRPPSTGDVCMGVWEQTGKATYKMKHIALAWGSSDSTPPVSPAAYLGPSILRAEVKLNRAANRFEGNLTIDVYQTDETTLVEHIGAKMIATRFRVD